uniref:Uncharacterized protein n=1 Tax=Rhodopseudomonas palustris (strain DX-1) TaxID=652103 RepID=E6VD55_RHOPX
MLAVETQNYAAILRAKSAEYSALHSLDKPNKDILLPCIVAASFLVKDQEKKRQLTKLEYRDAHLGRLAKSWGKRTCLLDPRLLKFDKDHQNDAIDLAGFLSDSVRFGCGIIPVIDLRTSELRRKAISKHWLATKYGLALRLTLSDLSNAKLGNLIQKILLETVIKPQECLLLLDFADADLSDYEGFGAFQTEWIFRVQEFGLWRRIISAATSYPETNPAPANGDVEVERSEWLAWRSALSTGPKIAEIAMFGDYGADNAKISFAGAGRAITHLRYATPDKWLVVRGGQAHELGDGTIRDVSRRILRSGLFAGEVFSAGDEFIAACADASGKPGNPTIWRAANMNHHLTRVTQDIAESFGVSLPAGARRKSVQEDLFARLGWVPA